MAKGNGCPTCHQHTSHLTDTGVHQCSNCSTIWFTPFDRSAAGQSRKGFECVHCGRMTVHPLGSVGVAKIWRCSICGTTIVDKA